MAWKDVQYENGKFQTGSGGGGGASSLTDLDDTNISSPTNGQVLKYNGTSSKWENANESGGTGHSYSSTEQVVGTWIDSKPLYERTITQTCSSNREVITLDATHIIKKAEGGVFNNNESDFIPFGYLVNSNDFVRFYTADNYLVIENGYYSSRPKAIITIRYTKTTD